MLLKWKALELIYQVGENDRRRKKRF